MDWLVARLGHGRAFSATVLIARRAGGPVLWPSPHFPDHKNVFIKSNTMCKLIVMGIDFPAATQFSQGDNDEYLL
jgi:hypothetical protein